MVAKISHPQYKFKKLFNEVLTSRKKYKNFYENIKADWVRQLDLYINVKGDPCSINPLKLRAYTKTKQEASQRKKSLVNLYLSDKRTSLFAVFKEMRDGHDLLFCPSCGDGGDPDTLDHYLPKDVFPELSILLMNLTPMCSKCQRIKKTEYLTKDGKKKFIHPYYDDIQEPIYHINFNEPYITPTFIFTTHIALDKEPARLALAHANGLNLERRLNNFCRKKYFHLLKLAKKCRKTKKNQLLPIIECRLMQEEMEKAINCWEAVFYRSVLSDDCLMDYLVNGKLPKKI